MVFIRKRQEATIASMIASNAQGFFQQMFNVNSVTATTVSRPFRPDFAVTVTITGTVCQNEAILSLLS